MRYIDLATLTSYKRVFFFKFEVVCSVKNDEMTVILFGI